MNDEINNNSMSNEFVDIETNSKNKYIPIVIILYIIVIILTIVLILGLKSQKDTIKDNLAKRNTNIQNNINNK